MLISQRRVLNVARHLDFLREDRRFVVGLSELGRHGHAITAAGLPAVFEGGSAVLPKPRGPVSRYNADGRWTIHRDQPRETVYRQVEWTRKEWRGRNSTEEVRDIRDVPYERYRRTRTRPPAIEIAYAQTALGTPALVVPVSTYTEKEHDAIRHKINLFLELFGECTIFTDQLEPLMRAPTRRLNWRLLPPGTSADDLRRELDPVLRGMGRRIRPVAEHRLREIERYSPNSVAVGRGGFTGYIVFGFPGRDFSVLEHLRVGNATYVLGEDWPAISQMTKTQIIDENRYLDRLVHTRGWESRIAHLLRAK